MRVSTMTSGQANAQGEQQTAAGEVGMPS